MEVTTSFTLKLPNCSVDFEGQMTERPRIEKIFFRWLFRRMEFHWCLYFEFSLMFEGLCRANEGKAKKWFLSWRDIMRKSQNSFGWLLRCKKVHLGTYLDSFKLFGGSCRASDWKAKKWLKSLGDYMRKSIISFWWFIFRMGFHYCINLYTSKLFGNFVEQITEKPSGDLRYGAILWESHYLMETYYAYILLFSKLFYLNYFWYVS